MINRLHLYGLLIIALPGISIAQGNNTSRLRPIIINGGDSIVHAYIQTEVRDYRPIANRTYYWFYAENIHSNLGGYSGSLLHQTYVVFDKEKNMIERGFFDNGLKTGTWKRWYPGGKLESEVNWKEGLLNGIAFLYNQDGSIYQSTEYKNGKKHGIAVEFKNDSLVKSYYKNGIELPNKSLIRQKSDHQQSDSLKPSRQGILRFIKRLKDKN